MTRSTRALTLAEMLVALAILMLVSVFEMGLFSSGSRMPVHVQQRMAVTEQARKYLESLLDSAPPPPPMTSQSGAFPAGYLAGYTYVMTVTNSTYDPMVYDINVTVTSPEGLIQSFRALKRSSTPNAGLALMNSYGCFACHALASGPPLAPYTVAPPLNKTNLSATVAQYHLADIQTLVTNRLNNPDVDIPVNYPPAPSVMPNFAPGGGTPMSAADQATIASFLALKAPP